MIPNPKFALSISGGAGIHHRTLSTQNQSFKETKHLRDSTEKGHLSFSFNIRFSKIWKNGITLSSGLSYTLVNDRFHWEKISEPEPSSSLAPGPTIFIPVRTTKNVWNQYHFLDIPILFGKEIEGKKAGVSINAGPMINLWFHQKGEFIGSKEEPVDFTKNKEGAYIAFRERAGLSFYASASLYYNINPKIQLLIEPFLRAQVTPMNLSEYPIKQKYNVTGLTLGVRKLW